MRTGEQTINEGRTVDEVRTEWRGRGAPGHSSHPVVGRPRLRLPREAVLTVANRRHGLPRYSDPEQPRRGCRRGLDQPSHAQVAHRVGGRTAVPAGDEHPHQQLVEAVGALDALQ